MGPNQPIVEPDIAGFVVKNSSTTAAAITAGNINADGKLYSLASDAVHNMTGLAAGADFHYLYIDDDASSPPVATIVDSITEPSKDAARGGWYNGDDKCIGVVWSPAASATISYFDAAGEEKNITYMYGLGDLLQLSGNMDPDFTWQTPNVTESAAALPVNATKIYIRAESQDLTAPCSFFAASSELAAVNTAVINGQINAVGYGTHGIMGSIILGPSRNIKIAGEDDDDNRLTVYTMGFDINR